MTSTAATDTVSAAKTTRTDSGSETTAARTRRPRASSDEGNNGNARYFLASEGEALVEALRLGVTYYEIQEYRVVPDFSGRKPLLGKEAVSGK
jgi:hypothetical protein